MEDNKELLIQLEQEEDYMIDELHECQIEDMKLEYHENLVLLQNLLKEVTSQIEMEKPNLIKIKEMILLNEVN